MLKQTIYPYLIISIVLSSCSNIYGPALLNADIAYQPKPISQDSIKHSNYIHLSASSGSGAEFIHEVSFAQANISRAYVFKNFNTSVGAYGFAGNYTRSYSSDNSTQDFSKKAFAGLGARASANYFLISERANFRIIGFEAGYSKEFGKYASFRKKHLGHQDYIINPDTEIFTAGFTTEIIWHTRKSIHTQHGFRLFIGDTFTNETYYDAFGDDIENQDKYVSLNYFLQIKRFNINIETASQSSRIGLGYRF